MSATATDTPSLTIVPAWVDQLIDACGENQAGFHFEEGGCFGFALALHEALQACEIEARLAAHADPRVVHAAVIVGQVSIDHQGDAPLGSAGRFRAIEDVASMRALAASHGVDEMQLDHDLEWARAVIHTARRLVDAAAPWPQHLRNEGEIADHVIEFAGDEVDPEFVHEFFRENYRDTQALLVRIPTAEIRVDESRADSHLADPELEKSYSQQPASTVPPVLLDEMAELVDGHHRRRVARARGDAWMWAYLMRDSALELGYEAKAPARMAMA